MESNRQPKDESLARFKSAVFVTMQNHWQYTELACRTLESFTPEDVELHLIDDCSSDNRSKLWLAKIKDNPRWRVWTHSTARGLTFGWNQALEYCLNQDLDFVGLMNNDIAVGPNWYPALLRSFQEDPRAGIVGPLTNHPGYQTLQDIIAAESPSPLSKKLSPQEVARHTVVDELCVRLQDLCQAAGQYTCELPYTNGFLFLLRGDVVRELGLFDPKNRNLGNEDEYQVRMKAKGWKSYCSLETFVWHAKDVSVAKGWKPTTNRLIPRLTAGDVLPASSNLRSEVDSTEGSLVVTNRTNFTNRTNSCQGCACCKELAGQYVDCRAADDWVSLRSGRCRLGLWSAGARLEDSRSPGDSSVVSGKTAPADVEVAGKLVQGASKQSSKVKVLSFATPGGAQSLFETYLKPSAERVGWEVSNLASGGSEVEFGQEGWYELMQLKAKAMLSAVDENLGKVIVWSDSDVLVVKSFAPEQILEDYDLAAQQDNQDLCTGLMVIRCSQKTRDVFYDTANAKRFYQPSRKGTSDQRAFNHVHRDRLKVKRIGLQHFWTPGARNLAKPNPWSVLNNIDQLNANQIPPTCLAVHANWCVGFALKRRVLDMAVKRFQLHLPN